MKLAICGSRSHMVSLIVIDNLIKQHNLNPVEIISGGATGIDESADHYADSKEIVFTEYKANWKKFGKAAGPFRNEEIADNADMLLLIWNGKSPGSANVKKCFEIRNKPVISIDLNTIDPKHIRILK